MKNRNIINLVLLSFCLFSCNQNKNNSPVNNIYKLGNDGVATITNFNDFVFEYDDMGNVVKKGEEVDLGAAKLVVYTIKDSSTYKMKVTTKSGYDLDQFIINDEVIKYTELDSYYKSTEGKYYEYQLNAPKEGENYSLSIRSGKEKTKSLLKTDTNLKNYFANKKYSILGDSISTFKDFNNNPIYNTTLAPNAVYYPYSGNTSGNLVLDMSDTYWGQMINDLNMELCVNNSSSGSFVYSTTTNKTQVACLNRCLNLHNDIQNIEPDIITVYLGINDHGYYCSNRSTQQIGEFNSLDDIKTSTGEYKDTNDKTFVTAYAMMIDKMVNRYPNSKIYVSSLVPGFYHYSQMDLQDLDVFNANIRSIAKYFNVGFVNMRADFKEDLSTLENYYEDYILHPNIKGMRKMAAAFENAIIKDLTYTN